MALKSPHFLGPYNNIATTGIDLAQLISIETSCSMGKIWNGFPQFLGALRAICPLTDRPEPASFLFKPSPLFKSVLYLNPIKGQ
jgi:hypothetical protein